jgi:hypothetical protein
MQVAASMTAWRNIHLSAAPLMIPEVVAMTVQTCQMQQEANHGEQQCSKHSNVL